MYGVKEEEKGRLAKGVEGEAKVKRKRGKLNERRKTLNGKKKKMENEDMKVKKIK